MYDNIIGELIFSLKSTELEKEKKNKNGWIICAKFFMKKEFQK